VAENMNNEFAGKIDLNIYLNDAPEAKGFELKSAAGVFVNKAHVPLLIALSNEKMRDYLKERII
jgi:hypothetical protein